MSWQTQSLQFAIAEAAREQGCTCKPSIQVTWLDKEQQESFVVVEHATDCLMELEDE